MNYLIKIGSIVPTQVDADGLTSASGEVRKGSIHLLPNSTLTVSTEELSRIREALAPKDWTVVRKLQTPKEKRKSAELEEARKSRQAQPPAPAPAPELPLAPVPELVRIEAVITEPEPQEPKRKNKREVQ